MSPEDVTVMPLYSPESPWIADEDSPTMDTPFASSYQIISASLLDSNVETKSCAFNGMNNTVVVAPGAKSKSVVD